MRKYKNTLKRKKYQRKRALRYLKRSREAKIKLKKVIHIINSLPKTKNDKKKPSIKKILAPSIFSLVDNTEETLNYFYKAHRELKAGNIVNFDIANIETLTTDAIAVQIAKIKDIRFHHGGGIMGNEPRKTNLKKIFQQSGFYDFVNSKNREPYSNNKLLVHKITKNKVEPKLAKEACLLGIKHTFKNEEVFDPLYDIIIEVMQNTNNHAGKNKGTYDWWLHVYNHPDSSKTSYTFLDLGIGIFESLSVQTYKRNLLEFFGQKSNLELVSKLFAGEIKSRTSRPERGKGIPQVFECSQNVAFEKFILISNNIYANLKNQEYKLLNTNFDGTLFYWELIDKFENEN